MSNLIGSLTPDRGAPRIVPVAVSLPSSAPDTGSHDHLHFPKRLLGPPHLRRRGLQARVLRPAHRLPRPQGAAGDVHRGARPAVPDRAATPPRGGEQPAGPP